MRATVIHGPGDVTAEERPDPQLRRHTAMTGTPLPVLGRLGP
jgi:hypothetical protein